MWKNTFKCKICDRPMPPRVYEFHLKKSHTPEEIQRQMEKNNTTLAELQTQFDKKTEELGEVFTEQIVKNKPFDWGEVYPCSTCKEEYPAKAMPFHSWVKHRV